MPRSDVLVLSEHPVFRRFWYAVGFGASVEARLVARSVLGTVSNLHLPFLGHILIS